MSNVDVVIIGAGAAGISAARHLLRAGRRIAVLEARDRIGGRAWTETGTLGIPVDMGCAWLHSADRNPWTTYARQHGFTVIERLAEWGAHIGAMKVPEAERAERGLAISRYDAILADAGRRGIDVAVSELLPQDKYRARFDSIVTFLAGAESARMSSLDFANYGDNEIDWAVKDGLGAVVAHAASGLQVRLNTAVRQIDARGPQLRVATDSGAIEAGAAIVTAPTGVLAAGTIGFLPQAPQAFLEAFAGLPMGSNSKVFFRMSPGSLPYAESTTFMSSQQTSRAGSYQAWPGGEEVLLAFFGGDLALELELRGETEQFAREELAQMFGSAFPDAIQQSLGTRWMHDPWARGSYSYALPGQAHQRTQLSEAMHGRIFFAGEACSVHAVGTIHGALESGISAADKALAILDS